MRDATLVQHPIHDERPGKHNIIHYLGAIELRGFFGSRAEGVVVHEGAEVHLQDLIPTAVTVDTCAVRVRNISESP